MEATHTWTGYVGITYHFSGRGHPVKLHGGHSSSLSDAYTQMLWIHVIKAVFTRAAIFSLLEQNINPSPCYKNIPPISERFSVSELEPWTPSPSQQIRQKPMVEHPHIPHAGTYPLSHPLTAGCRVCRRVFSRSRGWKRSVEQVPLMEPHTKAFRTGCIWKRKKRTSNCHLIKNGTRRNIAADMLLAIGKED